jgi:hypothetical protein
LNQPKYQIGDRIPDSELIVRGIAPQTNGDYLYFVQVLGSDNHFVGNHQDIIDCVTIINQKVEQLIKDKLPPDEYRFGE